MNPVYVMTWSLQSISFSPFRNDTFLPFPLQDLHLFKIKVDLLNRTEGTEEDSICLENCTLSSDQHLVRHAFTNVIVSCIKVKPVVPIVILSISPLYLPLIPLLRM